MNRDYVMGTIIEKFQDSRREVSSFRVQLDSGLYANLRISKHDAVVVEDENGKDYELDELSDNELEFFYDILHNKI